MPPQLPTLPPPPPPPKTKKKKKAPIASNAPIAPIVSNAPNAPNAAVTAQSQRAGQSGPHTGSLLLQLPLEDLVKKDGGAWNGSIKLKKSRLDTFEGERVLRVFYKKGSGTSQDPFQDSSGCSLVCQNRVVKGQTGLVVAFDVYFDPKNWKWSRGGKFGGLFVGPGVASGYRHSPDGSSHRMMWQKDGGAISYIYPPSDLKQVDAKLQASGHGVGYFGDTFPAGTLKVGQWNHIEIGIKVNTFSKDGKPNADGKSMLCVNGKCGILTNVRWARESKLKIDKFEYGTFFGGPDPAVVDSVSYVKNFRVYAWKD